MSKSIKFKNNLNCSHFTEEIKNSIHTHESKKGVNF